MTGTIPARAARLAVALLATTAVTALAAGTAGAMMTKTPFEASYTFTELTGGAFGAVHCTGKRQVNPKFAAKGWLTETRDVEKCVSTEASGKLIGLAAGEKAALFPGSNGWYSDYDAKFTATMEYKVSANAKNFKLVAYY